MGWTERLKNRKVSRRQAFNEGGLIVAAVGSVLNTSFSSTWEGLPFPHPPFTRPEIMGLTVSQVQCEKYLKMNYLDTLDAALGLFLDAGRLCIYWNESEPKEGVYDFSKIQSALEKVEAHNKERAGHGIPSLEVTLAQGDLFSPRTPEFFPPKELSGPIIELARRGMPINSVPEFRNRMLAFTGEATKATLGYPCITERQYQNEALVGMPLAQGVFVEPSFMRDGVATIKAIDPDTKLSTTTPTYLVAYDNRDEMALNALTELPFDSIGLNIYTKVPSIMVPVLRAVGIENYHEPGYYFWTRVQAQKAKIEAAGKKAYIAEAQGEAWHRFRPVYTDNPEHPTYTPRRSENLISTLAILGFGRVDDWGTELRKYWLDRGYRGGWDQLKRLSKYPGLLQS